MKTILMALCAITVFIDTACAQKYSGVMTTNIENVDSGQIQLQENIVEGKTRSTLKFKFLKNSVQISSKGYFRDVPLKRGTRYEAVYYPRNNNCFIRTITRVNKISSVKLSWYNSYEAECADGGYLRLYQRMVMSAVGR
jgi:hypothetical protein